MKFFATALLASAAQAVTLQSGGHGGLNSHGHGGLAGHGRQQPGAGQGRLGLGLGAGYRNGVGLGELNEHYYDKDPIHQHLIRSPIEKTYLDEHTYRSVRPDVTYDTIVEQRTRRVPYTVYDDVEETRYNTVERTEIRRVPDNAFNFILTIKLGLH